MPSLLYASSATHEAWLVCNEVYTVRKGYVDIDRLTGFPMGARWECSRFHFDRHFTLVYEPLGFCRVR